MESQRLRLVEFSSKISSLKSSSFVLEGDPPQQNPEFSSLEISSKSSWSLSSQDLFDEAEEEEEEDVEEVEEEEKVEELP